MNGFDTREDEEAAANARAVRAQGAAEQALDRFECPEPHVPRPRRIFAGLLWDAQRGCAVPDTVGRLVYQEDFIA